MIKKSKLISVTKEKIKGLLTRQKIEGLVFFVMCYVYLWLVVDLRLVPNVAAAIAKFPVFYLGWNFFSVSSALPGGLVNYLSSFLVQFFYISWVGAIVVTFQAWLIYFCTRKFLDCLKLSSFYCLSFTGPLLILILYNKYMYFFNIVTGLLFALIFANIYVSIVSNKKKNPLLIFLILSLALYPIAGGSLLLFGILCVIFELIDRTNFPVAGIELLLTFSIPFLIGVMIYDIGTMEAYTQLLPLHENMYYVTLLYYDWIIIGCIFYLFLPLMSTISWLINKIPKPVFLKLWRKNKLLYPLGLLLFLLFVSLSLYYTYDSKNKNIFTADYYASQRNWQKAIRSAEREKYHPFMIFIINRALYHQGRLPQNMFLYPQQTGVMLYGLSSHNYKGILQEIDICIDLGLFGYAEYHTWTKVETFGPLPELLKRLALINMVKGDIDSASVYLEKLGKTIFYSNWANKYLAKIKKNPTLSEDQRIQNFRRNMLKSDFILDSKKTRWIFSKLLDDNRKNKIAFEYQMAIYLINRYPQGVVENLYRLEDFDYKEIPKPYEEAFFICLMQKNTVMIPESFKVSKESKRKFRKFAKFMNSYGRDLYAVEKEVSTTYRNTYYEYFFYGYKYNSSKINISGGKK